jgi:hypothetical protein
VVPETVAALCAHSACRCGHTPLTDAGVAGLRGTCSCNLGQRHTCPDARVCPKPRAPEAPQARHTTLLRATSRMGIHSSRHKV